MEQTDRSIHKIITASKQGRLVFFIGAGCSALSGYPSWFNLVNEFHKKLYGRDADKEKLSDQDYIRIPQMFLANFSYSSQLFILNESESECI